MVEPCLMCQRPLTGRQRACSGKCRAALSRKRKAEDWETTRRRVCELLQAALRLLENDTLQVIYR
jgi:predicted nucleic acid-binding Zn ribbon protein